MGDTNEAEAGGNQNVMMDLRDDNEIGDGTGSVISSNDNFEKMMTGLERDQSILNILRYQCK